MRPRGLLLSALLSTSACGTWRTIPAPAAPEPVLPADAPAAGPTGTPGIAHVVIATDVPARVEFGSEVVFPRGRLGVGSTRKLACAATPCDVTLLYGDYELLFQGLDDRHRCSSTLLKVHEPSIAIRHVLGQERSGDGQVLGGSLVGLGLVLLVIGGAAALVSTNPSHGEAENQSASHAAVALSLSGLGAMLGGGIVLGAFPGIRQPGASTQWSPPESAARVGGSIGVRF